jgi:hypothetical protein
VDNTERFRLETAVDGVHDCETCGFEKSCEIFQGAGGMCTDYVVDDEKFLERNRVDYELPE